MVNQHLGEDIWGKQGDGLLRAGCIIGSCPGILTTCPSASSALGNPAILGVDKARVSGRAQGKGNEFQWEKVVETNMQMFGKSICIKKTLII